MHAAEKKTSTGVAYFLSERCQQRECHTIVQRSLQPITVRIHKQDFKNGQHCLFHWPF